MDSTAFYRSVIVSRWVVRIAALLALTCSAKAAGNAAPVREEFAVPQYARNLIVPVSVYGNILRFGVDTGATRTTFDADHRKLLGSEAADGQAMTAVGIERRGRYVAPPMWLGKIPLSPDGLVNCQELGTFNGAPRDGILGMDILQQLVVEVDFDEGKFRILSDADAAGAERIPLQRSSNVPMVRAKVGRGEVEQFFVDTGARGNGAGTLAGPVFDRLLGIGAIHIIGEAELSTRSRKVTAPIGRVTRMSLGEHVHHEPVFVRSEVNALGLDYWSRYVVTFDFPNNVLYLRPGKEYNRRDSFNESGLRFRRLGPRTIVAKVAPRSPAERSGVQPDDELIAIDGQGVSSLSIRQIERQFHAEGTAFCLRLLRQSTVFELTIITPTEPVNTGNRALDRADTPAVDMRKATGPQVPGTRR